MAITDNYTRAVTAGSWIPTATGTGNIEIYRDENVTTDTEYIKKWLETQGSYTNEDIKAIIRLLEHRLQESVSKLERKITDLEETNKEILKKLNFICERKRRAQNLQYGLRG